MYDMNCELFMHAYILVRQCRMGQVESDFNFRLALELCAAFADQPPSKREFEASQGFWGTRDCSTRY